MKQIVQDLEQQTQVDYVNVSAGVHHAFIHTPMEFEAGWERGYARGIKDVSSKPVLLVGRITTPDVAEMLLESGDADAICLARQLFADADWAAQGGGGARGGHPEVRRGQLLLEERQPRRPRPVRLQPGDRAGSDLGKRDADPRLDA